MKDFELPEVVALIEKVQPRTTSSFWMNQYLGLQGLFMYFQYAVSQVRIQEENLRQMENGEHNNFSSHDEYAESDLQIYSSALGAYAHMRACLLFAYDLSDGISSDQTFIDFRAKNRPWAKGLIDARDRLQAHPNEEWALVWKRSNRSSEGRIEFPIRNMKNISESTRMTIHPRKDLESLRQYIQNLVLELDRLYSNHS